MVSPQRIPVNFESFSLKWNSRTKSFGHTCWPAKRASLKMKAQEDEVTRSEPQWGALSGNWSMVPQFPPGLTGELVWSGSLRCYLQQWQVLSCSTRNLRLRIWSHSEESPWLIREGWQGQNNSLSWRSSRPGQELSKEMRHLIGKCWNQRWAPAGVNRSGWWDAFSKHRHLK